MSIVLVCLSNAPKVSDEAVKKDAELDKHLESRVEGKKCILFIRNTFISFLSVKTKTNKSPETCHGAMIRENIVRKEAVRQLTHMCFNTNLRLFLLSLQDNMQPLTLQRLMSSNKIVILLMFCLWNIIKRIYVVCASFLVKAWQKEKCSVLC